MTEKEDLGRQGEHLACEYLREKGYQIVERNFRKPWGELDIIAYSPDKTLVFIEVKTMTSESNLKPEDQMTVAKLRKFKRVASLYAGHRQEIISNKKGWRLDLIAVIYKTPPLFRHYENIV